MKKFPNILVFDKKTESLLAVLSNKNNNQCKYFGDEVLEQLNKDFTFKFSVSAKHKDAAHLTEGNLVGFFDEDSNFQLFEIYRVEDVREGKKLTKIVNAEHAVFETEDNIVTDLRVINGQASEAMPKALNGSRWNAGQVDSLGSATINYYYADSRKNVKETANAYKGELRYRVAVTANTISTRYVDLLSRRGSDTGMKFTYTKNLKSIKRTVERTGLKTALYGRGKGEEIEATGGYTRKVTFADVVWTKANGDPVDKPAGQEWVGDPTALARYGRANGTRHRFGTFDFDTTDPVILLQKTWEQVQLISTPKVTYEMSVLDLERLTGISRDKIRLGDTVYAIDKDLRITIEARIIEIRRSLDGRICEVVLGNFIDDIADYNKKLEQIESTVTDRKGVWDSGGGPISDSDWPDIVPATPTNFRASGAFKTIMLAWDFEPSSYVASYEIYASKVNNFTADISNRVWSGKAGGYVHQGDINETWYFRIRAVNTHGTKSALSSQISANTVQIKAEDILPYVITNELIAENAAIDFAKLANVWITNAMIDSIEANKITSGRIQTKFLDVRDITNLVYNSVFEQGDAGWGTGNEIIGNPGHSQSVAGKVVRQMQRDSYFGDDFPVTEGEQFHVGCFAWGGGSSVSFNMGIRFMDINGNYTWVNGPGWLPGSGWSRKESTITAPSGSVYGHVWFQIAGFSNLGYWLYDRAFVRRVGLITFDKAEGGAVKLGEKYGDGQLHVYNGSGNIVGRIDTNGVYAPRLQSDNIVGNVVNKYDFKANRTIYIDVNNGNDSNDGLSEAWPKRDLQAFLDGLPKDLNRSTLTIRCTGTLHAELSIAGFRNGEIQIVEWTNGARLVVTGSLWVTDCHHLLVRNVTFHGFGGNGNAMIHAMFCHDIHFYGVKCYGGTSQSHAFWIFNTNYLLEYCEVYNVTDRALYSTRNSRGVLINGSGNPAVAVLSEQGSTVAGYGTRWAGTLNGRNGGEVWGEAAWSGVSYGEAAPPVPPTPTEQTFSQTASTGDNYSTQGFWTNDEVKQGSWGYGDRYGLWYFDLSAIKGKTILSAVITVNRGSGGTNAARTIQFRTHNYTSRGLRPGGTPAMSGVGATGSLAVGATGTFDITAMVQNNIANGVDNSIGIHTTGSTDYMSLGTRPTITIRYR